MDAEAPAGSFDVRVLGPIEVYRDGEFVRLGGPKQQTVLGLLVAAAGRAVSAEALIDGLWGESPPSTARGTLQSHVSGLRAAIGEAVVWKGGTYRLDVARDDVDAWRFEDEVAAARDLVGADPLVAVERLRAALDLWRGHAYAGAGDSEPLAAEARRLEELRLSAIEDRIEAELALGRHGELVAELEVLTVEHPLRERLRGQQMLALYRSGRQAEALEAFTRLRETLADELGLDPSPELRRLEQQILSQAGDLEVTPVASATGESEHVFLFTDLEGSTPLWDLHPEAMEEAVAEHDAALRTAIEAHAGEAVKWTGDGVLAVLPTVDDATAVACEVQRRLAGMSWGPIEELAVRMAIDAGPAQERDGDYFGAVLNRCARLLGAAHGGQVLLSDSAQAALTEGADCAATDLGEHRLKGFGRPQRVFQLTADGLASEFPALRMDGTGGVTGFAWLGAVETLVRGYQLGQRVGEGDFGVVYRALQTSVQREVAVKVIRPEYANRPVFIRRFEAEAQFVAQLEHPHVVSLYDYWRDPDGAYLVMPFMRGGSLADALRRGPWNLGPALHLLDQVGAALSYAHRNGIVHRDVKPGNILLDEDGNAYLSDFGIASRLYDEVNAPVTTSLSYVPPEELRGESLGPRSDVFSLAVLTFELLTGIRPSSRELPSLDEARSDLPAELATVLRVATDDDPQARYEKVEDFLRAVRQAVGADVVTVAAAERRDGAGAPVRNPFKGLRAFQETDAGDFYGREALVDELLQAVSHHRLVAVVGASGSGKSSVVRAGLLPALRAGGLAGSRGWLFADMFPGSYPFEELEAALLRVAVTHPGGMLAELRSDDRGILRLTKQVLPPDESELVLVIDQFEELFSLVDDEATRRLFLDALHVLVTDERSRVRVVLTMRADFFDRPLDYPGFSDLFKAALVPVTAPSDESLGQAISRPARSVGLDLEPGLVGEITADVQNQPGALPLLQYALTELFQRRDDDRLTIDGYRATGGVLAALGRRAEEIYEGLPPAGQEAARHLFLRLVNVDEETDDTRRRVSQSELDGMDVEPDVLQAVIQQFASYRLLAFDRDAATRIPTVEVAHEALIREWPRLRGWIDDQRQNLVFHRRLQATLREWIESDRDPSFLLRGARLEAAERWAESGEIALSRQETEYLDASREHRATEEADARRRRRRVVIGLAVALAVVSVLAVVALVQSRVAAAEARDADARRLAGAVVPALSEDPERGILLALESAYLSRDAGEPLLPESIGALHHATQASRVIHRIGDGSTSTSFSSDGRLLATNVVGDAGDPGTDVSLWDAETGVRVATLPGDARVAVVRFSPTGSLLAVAAGARGQSGVAATPITVWDAAEERVVARLDGPAFRLPMGGNMTRALAWSPDGSRIAATTGLFGSGTMQVVVWDARSGSQVSSVPVDRFVLGIDFLDTETLLVAEGGEHRVAFYDIGSAEMTDAIKTAGVAVQSIVLDRRRQMAIVSSQPDNIIQAWDLASRTLRWNEEHVGGGVIAASPGAGLVAAAGNSGLVRVFDIEDGAEVAAFSGHTASVWGGAFSPDGRRLAAVGTNGTTLVWDVSPAGPAAKGAIAFGPGTPFAMTFLPDGARATVTSDDGAIHVVDLATGEVVRSLDGLINDWYLPAPVSPDGRHVATVSADGVSHVRDGGTLAVVSELPPCTSPRAFSPDSSAIVLDGLWLCGELDEPPPDADLRSRVVDLATGEELLDLGERLLFGPGHVFNQAGAFEAGRFLAVNNDAFAVEVFDVPAGTSVAALEFDDDFPLSLAFDPTGRRLAVGTQNGRALVLDLAAVVDGSDPWDAVVFDMTVGTGGIPGVALNADGLLVTTGFHGVLRLWNVPSRQPVADLSIAADTWAFGFFSPDGRYLLHGDIGLGGGHILRRFPLDTDELIAAAEARLTRGLASDECRRYLVPQACA